MPRASKSKASASASTTASTSSPAPAKSAAKKTTSKKKSASASVPAAPVVVAATPPAPVVTEPATSELTDSFTEFLGKLNQVASQFSALRTEFRTLERKWSRELKAAQKLAAKKKKKAGNRQPSGFVKPTLISNELANFLGKEQGSQMARTEVTREINKYIREHSLQDKENGRKINPDNALRSLLQIPQSDQLTYFNLQRYMSPHFAKMGDAAPAADMQA
jgi:chromatin remodeling complex protein RSC6